MASPLSDSEGRVYVSRRPAQEPQARARVAVSLQFADPKLTATSSTALPKWYHLNRDALEPLQASLARLRLNIIANRLKLSKRNDKKSKSSRAKPPDDASSPSAAPVASDPDALPPATEKALSEAGSSFKITKRGVELPPAQRSKPTIVETTPWQQSGDDDASFSSALLGDPAHGDLRITLHQKDRRV